MPVLKDSSAGSAGQVLHANMVAEPQLRGKVFLTLVADVVSARVCRVLLQTANAPEGTIAALTGGRHDGGNTARIASTARIEVRSLAEIATV